VYLFIVLGRYIPTVFIGTTATVLTGTKSPRVRVFFKWAAMGQNIEQKLDVFIIIMDHLLVRMGYIAVFHEILTDLLRKKSIFWRKSTVKIHLQKRFQK